MITREIKDELLVLTAPINGLARYIYLLCAYTFPRVYKHISNRFLAYAPLKAFFTRSFTAPRYVTHGALRSVRAFSRETFLWLASSISVILFSKHSVGLKRMKKDEVLWIYYVRDGSLKNV